MVTKGGENDKRNEFESTCNLVYKQIEYGENIGKGAMVSNGELSQFEKIGCK